MLEYSVIVVGVHRGDFVGEERRRVQELHVGLDCDLVDVMGLGLITCGDVELVSRVHTLVERSAQVFYELQVLEEEEKVREEVPEIERATFRLTFFTCFTFLFNFFCFFYLLLSSFFTPYPHFSLFFYLFPFKNV